MAEVPVPARLRRALPGAAPIPVTFTLLAQSEGHQRERASPVRRGKSGTDLMFGSVLDFPSPALLNRPGGLRNLRTVRASAHASGGKSQGYSLATRSSPSAQPKPRTSLRCSAARRGPMNHPHANSPPDGKGSSSRSNRGNWLSRSFICLSKIKSKPSLFKKLHQQLSLFTNVHRDVTELLYCEFMGVLSYLMNRTDSKHAY